jgi:Tol biopolymer transport system component
MAQSRTRLLPMLGVAIALAALIGLVTALLTTPTRAPATFGGTNGRISFTGFVHRTESLEIFSAKPNGGDIRRLTSNPRHFSVVSDWSPHGQKIAFDSDRVDVDGRKHVIQIYLMNSHGSGVTQLTTGPGEQKTPGWSPDASSLAIDADWGGGHARQGIWIIPASDPDGVTQPEAQRLTKVPASAKFDTEPQFSPDGSSIVFTRFRDIRTSATFRVDTDGTDLKRLTPWRLNTSDPDWSPNGQKITVDSNDAGQTGKRASIYVMRADGSGRTRLTDYPILHGEFPGAGLANNPVWSPSGTRIMFTHFLPGENELVAMKPNGSHKHVVVDGRFGRRRFPNKVDWGTHP